MVIVAPRRGFAPNSWDIDLAPGHSRWTLRRSASGPSEFRADHASNDLVKIPMQQTIFFSGGKDEAGLIRSPKGEVKRNSVLSWVRSFFSSHPFTSLCFSRIWRTRCFSCSLFSERSWYHASCPGHCLGNRPPRPRGWTHSTLCLSDCVAVSLELLGGVGLWNLKWKRHV